VAPAIRSLIEEAIFNPFPDKIADQPIKTKWLMMLLSSAAIARKALSELPGKEVSRLRDRAEVVLNTAGSDFTVYLNRAAKAFGRVRQDLPNHAAGDLSDWFRAYTSKEGFLKFGSGSEHDRLRTFLETRPLDKLLKDAPIPALLDEAVLAPAESLESIYTLVKDTAALVNSLVEYLAQHESAASNPQDLATVIDFGERVSNKTSELKGLVT
jgi:hypothetical protein